MFVEALLAKQAMLSEGEAVISRENDDGVVSKVEFCEAGQKTADLGIEVGDHAVVVGELFAENSFGAGPGGELLITDRQLAIVEGVSGEEIGRQSEAGRVVERSELLGRNARIVRSHVGDVGNERAVFGTGFEKADLSN